MRPFAEGIRFVDEVHRSGWEKAKEKFGMDEDEARKWWGWYEREVCKPWVVYEGEGGMEEVEGIEGEAEEVERLPLVVRDVRKAGFAGKVYNLEREGLYRFAVLTRSVRNLIVAREDRPLPILRALSAIQVHGNRDGGKSIDELKELLLNRTSISVTCGIIASLTVAVLTDLGFRARFVTTLILEDWNTYDNGHALCEVFIPEGGKWALVDVDMGFMFMMDGVYLDAYEFWKCLREGERVEFSPLSEKFVDPFFLGASGFNYFLCMKYLLRDLESKKAWYKRIFQIVGIKDGDKTVFFGPEDEIRSYYAGDWFDVVPLSEWRARSYGS